jgi:hypothetical protein
MRRFGRLLTKREGGALVIELPVTKKSRHAMSMNIRVTVEDPVDHVIHHQDVLYYSYVLRVAARLFEAFTVGVSQHQS